ncbi:MAG: DsbA family oxidoreductase [Polyangiaceae bacterium]
MQIDVWSDVVCPWCWLGNARLENALAGFSHGEQVDVVFHSFELDPGEPVDRDIPTDQLLATKFGVGPAQIDAMHDRLRALGRAEGIDYQFQKARTSNTFEAHQILHLAAARGKQPQMVARLFRANFSEGVRVGDRIELVRLGAEVGLEAGEIEEALAERRYEQAVRDDEAEARAHGISGVPFFVADGRLAASGAQSTEVLRALIEKAWSTLATQGG